MNFQWICLGTIAALITALPAQAITHAQIARMRYYAPGQSQKAIESLIGPPDYWRDDLAVYRVAGTGNLIEAGRRFVVLYVDRGNGKQAQSWW
jgi:hypothetical protein